MLPGQAPADEVEILSLLSFVYLGHRIAFVVDVYIDYVLDMYIDYRAYSSKFRLLRADPRRQMKSPTTWELTTIGATQARKLSTVTDFGTARGIKGDPSSQQTIVGYRATIRRCFVAC